MPIPYSDLRALSQPSPIVELFILDATILGGGVYRYTNESTNQLLAGAIFYPMPIKMTGFGMNADGAPMKPTVTVSNVSKEMLSAAISLGDIVGAQLQRIRIFAKNLDGGSAPDSTRIIGPEVFLVDQKVIQNNTVISWNLSAVFDRPGTKLPIRQALRDPTSNSTGFPALSRRRIQ